MPHIIWPLRFTLPHHKGLRPSWLLRLGLFIYDHMGGRKLLPPTKKINLKKHKSGIPLKDKFSIGFEYSDCWACWPSFSESPCHTRDATTFPCRNRGSWSLLFSSRRSSF